MSVEEGLPEEVSRLVARAEGDESYPMPDLTAALHRRQQRQRRSIGVLTAVAALALVAVALVVTARPDTDAVLTARAPDPVATQLVLLDGTTLTMNLPPALASAAPVRVTGSSRLRVAGDCCPFPDGEFNQAAGVPPGDLVDEWENESGLSLQAYRQSDNTLIASTVVGRFRMVLRLPSIERKVMRNALRSLEVSAVGDGWAVLAPRSIAPTLPVSSSLDFGPAEPLVTVARSTCSYEGLVHPSDADFPTTQRCYPDAGVELTAQRSGSGASLANLDSLVKTFGVNDG